MLPVPTNIVNGKVEQKKILFFFQVMKGRIEEVELPEKVDIIISEWMGFYLFHESMLDSVLVARDKFLKDDGVLFPDKCELFAAFCVLPDFYTRWEDVSSIKMNSYALELRKTYNGKPKIMRIPVGDLIAKETSVAEFHLKYVEREELDHISRKLVAVSKADTLYHGLCIWFTVTFPSLTSSGRETVLSTAPDCSRTHWKQTVLVLEEGIATEEGTLIVGNLSLKRSPENPRLYDIVFQVLDPDEEEHPIPCDCSNTRCKIVKALSDQYDERDMEIVNGVD